MVDMLCRELVIRKDYLEGEIISTIYFGGGTPSILDSRSLSKILNTIHANYEIESGIEVTIETNPDDFSEGRTEEWFELGINRLSIGIQSFDDRVLKYMNRAHDSMEARKAIEMARSYGFDNLNIDLIYGIPGFDHNRWNSDLEIVENYKPEHISAYCLTIEENTVFGRWLSKGKIDQVSEDFSAEEFKMLSEKLTGIDFIHYEVSNFCRPGMESKHNTGYWKNQKYLGIGPGAHSYNNESRQYNVSNNIKFIKSLKENALPIEVEILNKEQKTNEYLLTSLRTRWGASISHLKEELGYDIILENEDYLKELEGGQLCEIQNGFIKLTPSGFLLADKISSDLFIDIPGSS
jgi:oxygen-independent coproporphyrinogen-3 oxidase